MEMKIAKYRLWKIAKDEQPHSSTSKLHGKKKIEGDSIKGLKSYMNQSQCINLNWI